MLNLVLNLVHILHDTSSIFILVFVIHVTLVLGTKFSMVPYIQQCLLIYSAHVHWDLTSIYNTWLYFSKMRCWHRVCGALASPHRLTLGWQSVSENSGDALRPEAPAALLRAAATVPSTRLACPRASTRLRRCYQCSPHTIALQWSSERTVVDRCTARTV